jgi:hypothetical protein
MKPESAKKIADAYFEVFEELSLKAFNHGIALVIDNLEEQIQKLRSIRTREDFVARLIKEPEPLTLDAQIELIYALPGRIRKVMPGAMKEMSNVLPRDPGGRPISLDDEDARFVCEEIGRLYGRGVSLVNAQKRLSQVMSKQKGKDVSLRTIQRAWQNRHKWSAHDGE